MINNADLKQLLEICNRITKSSQNTTTSAVSIKKTTTTLAEDAKKQSTTAHQSLATVESIDRSLQVSVSQVEMTNNSLAELLQSIIEKNKGLHEIETLLKNIEASIEKIDSIAMRSRMLALNATIEAGRIGDAGRGFGVVAHEIKDLAGITEKSSAAIKKIIEETSIAVKEKISESTTLAESGFTKIQESHSSIDDLKKIFDASDVNTDRETLPKLLANFQQIANKSVNIERSSNELLNASNELNAEVEDANGIVSDLIGIVKGTPIQNLNVVEANKLINDFEIIDVRRKDEFKDSLGHIENAVLATIDDGLKEELAGRDITKKYLFVCRSGGRSARAAREAQNLGFKLIFNLEGGMLKWREENLPSVERAS